MLGKATKPNVPSVPTPERSTLEPHEVLLSPAAQGGIVAHNWGKHAGEADVSVLAAHLSQRVKSVSGGDMHPVEAMLMSQAVALETIFTNLSARACRQEYMKQLQTYLTLALKAQAQCRATLEALAEIKNPRPVLIAKQANVSNGPQQVNNGLATQSGAVRAGAHAGQTASLQNGLLEAFHEPPAAGGNAVQGDVGGAGDKERAARYQESVATRRAQQSARRS